jgi:hypothetical protein
MIRIGSPKPRADRANRKCSPKPRFATYRAKAVPIAKVPVLQGFMRLRRVLQDRQKGLVDHNYPAVFSQLRGKRKVPLTIANLVSDE